MYVKLKGIWCSFKQYCFHLQLVQWGKYTVFVENTAWEMSIPVIRRDLRIGKGKNWWELTSVCTLKIPSIGSHTFVWTYENTARACSSGWGMGELLWGVTWGLTSRQSTAKVTSGQRSIHPVTSTTLSHWIHDTYHCLQCRKRSWKNEVDWTEPAEIWLAVREAYKATLWPAAGFKRGNATTAVAFGSSSVNPSNFSVRPRQPTAGGSDPKVSQACQAPARF